MWVSLVWLMPFLAVAEDSLVVIELGFAFAWPVSPVETGTADSQILNVTNFGTVDASAFSDAGLLAGTAFSYTGGSYPGSAGTCPTAGVLAAGGTCTLEIQFAPQNNRKSPRSG